MKAPDVRHFDKRAVAFDGNWMLWRNLSSLMVRISTPAVAQNWQRYLVDMTVGQIARTANLLAATELVVFFDGPHNFRYDVYPEYKASRRDKQPRASADDVEDDVDVIHPMQAFPLLSQVLIERGYAYSVVERYEADDLMASYAKHFEMGRKGDVLYLMTRDKDILQSIAPNVIRYTPAVGKKSPETYVTADTMLTAAATELGKGLTPYQHLVYQVLAGDSGDDVPGILGPKSALAVVRDPSFTTMSEWLKTPTGKVVATNHRAELNRNAQLVKLVSTLYLQDTKPHKMLNLPKAKLTKTEVTNSSIPFSKSTLAAIQALNTRLTYDKRGLFSGPARKTVNRASLIKTE